MKIDDSILDYLAKLSKLSFSAQERESIKGDLDKLIGFVDKIGEIDTEGVLPLTHVSETVNVLRADMQVDSLTQTEALKNAPQKDSDYFKIPKVLTKK